MLKTSLIWLFIFASALSTVSAFLKIIEPLDLPEWWTSNPGLTSYSIARFGEIPWGSQIVGQIGLASPLDACFPLEIGETGGSAPPILIAMRGNCQFFSKARYAEEAGAKLLLIVDNQYEDVKTHAMVDNSYNKRQFQTVSAMIQKEGGDKLIETVRQSEERGAIVSGAFTFVDPNQIQESVNYHVWLSIGSKLSWEFLQDFKQYYDKLSPLATMEIHFKTLSNDLGLIDSRHCHCGKYCFPWTIAENYFKSGPQVLYENIKQRCIINQFGQDTWWRYILGFADSCLNKWLDTQKCSDSIIEKKKLNATAIDSCVRESFHFSSSGQCEYNSLLDQEVANGKDKDALYPSAKINGFEYPGHLLPSSQGFFSAICYSFNKMPEVCKTALNLTQSNSSESLKLPSPEDILKVLPPIPIPSSNESEAASNRDPSHESSSSEDSSTGNGNITISISESNLVIILAVVFCVVFALFVLFLYRRSVKRLEASMQANRLNGGFNLSYPVQSPVQYGVPVTVPYTALRNNSPVEENNSSGYQA